MNQGDIGRVVWIGAAVAILTNGPSVYFSQHVANDVLSFETAWFLYPFMLVAGTGFYLLFSWRKSLPVWHPAIALTFTTGCWLIVTSFTSVLPTLAPLRVAVTCGVLAFGVWAGASQSRHCLAIGVHLGAALPVVASAIAVAFWPDIAVTGPDQFGFDPGYYQGVFANRNSLGPVAMLVVLTTPVAAAEVRRRGWPRSGIAALAITFGSSCWMIVGARSSTAIAAGAVGVAAAFVVVLASRLLRGRLPSISVGLAAATTTGLALVLAFVNLERLMTAFGGEATLTNRRVVWRSVRTLIADRPAAGYGFWSAWESPDFIGDGTNGTLPPGYGSAHNSVLEMGLAAGIPGAAMFAALLVGTITVVTIAVWRSPSIATWTWAAVGVFLALENMMESFVLFYSYNFVLLAAIMSSHLYRNADSSEPSPAVTPSTLEESNL